MRTCTVTVMAGEVESTTEVGDPEGVRDSWLPRLLLGVQGDISASNSTEDSVAVRGGVKMLSITLILLCESSGRFDMQGVLWTPHDVVGVST
jgi:hypothetical protein